MQITVKLRLRDKHAAELNRHARAMNFVWNYCNEVQQQAVKWGRRWPTGFDLQKLTAGSSKELDVYASSIGRVCIHYAESRQGARKAKLRWRGAKSLGWVPFGSGHVKVEGSTIKWMGTRFDAMHSRPELCDGKFGAGSFNADAKGRWYINVPVTISPATSSKHAPIGVDLGLKTLATLSDGRKVEMPSFFRKSELALGSAQRARKTKRVRAIHAKVRNRRRDFLHKASKEITRTCGLIIVGDVNPKRFAHTWLAKGSLDAGWYDFKCMLAYKAIMHGGGCIEVNERNTSQTCSECGCLPPLRPRGIAGLGIREWTCSDCGAVHDRDVNAARNILRLGLETLVAGAAKAERPNSQAPSGLH